MKRADLSNFLLDHLVDQSHHQNHSNHHRQNHHHLQPIQQVSISAPMISDPHHTLLRRQYGAQSAESLPPRLPATVAATAATATAVHREDLSQLPSLRARVRVHVHGVILCLPSSQDSQAYMEAMQKCPDLVETETDPIQFVRCCDYDILNAAKRLCMYWTERVKLFGSQRAFLPLVLTGTGALTPEDVHTIHAGYPAILPDTTTGRKVILEDRSNWTRTASMENKLRAWFYCMCILSKDIMSQTEGYVTGLIVLVTPRDRDMDWNLVHRLAHLGSQVFPIKPSGHFISIPNRRKRNLITAFSQTVMDICRHWYDNPQMQFHVESEPNQVLRELMEVGFTKKGIPLSFGGEWKNEDWYNWCQERKEWEQELYRDRLLKKAPSSSSSGDHSGSRYVMGDQVSESVGATASSDSCQVDSGNRRHPDHHRHSAAAQPQGGLGGGDDDPMDEEQAQARRESVLRSRRHRERRKEHVKSLKEDHAKLSFQNSQLRAEQERLVRLVEEAQNVVSLISRQDAIL